MPSFISIKILSSTEHEGPIEESYSTTASSEKASLLQYKSGEDYEAQHHYFPPKIKTYKTRFWIVFITSYLCWLHVSYFLSVSFYLSCMTVLWWITTWLLDYSIQSDIEPFLFHGCADTVQLRHPRRISLCSGSGIYTKQWGDDSNGCLSIINSQNLCQYKFHAHVYVLFKSMKKNNYCWPVTFPHPYIVLPSDHGGENHVG